MRKNQNKIKLIKLEK